MELTEEIIKKNGFKRINNSMWKCKNITLQNSWDSKGCTLIEKIISMSKCYKVCVDGRYKCLIKSELDLKNLKNSFGS